MFSTNKVLLFVAALMLCVLLMGLELGIILIVTALVCFSSYEPFSNEEGERVYEDLEDTDQCLKEFDLSTADEPASTRDTNTKSEKMSLWKPRTPSNSRVKAVRPNSNSNGNTSTSGFGAGFGSPISSRPPIRSNTNSPYKPVFAASHQQYEDRENSSLFGNSYGLSMSHTERRSEKSNLGHSSKISSSKKLLSSPFLPRVKRAIGLGEASILQNSGNSPRRTSYGVTGANYSSPQSKAAQYPSMSSPGWMPLVRLGRHEKPILNENNSNMVHSPGTVKIAAPVQRRPVRRLSISQEEPAEIIRKAPDKESVLTALREKSRKRAMTPQDESMSEAPDQQSKRRKQDDSTSSSSSMVSEPEFLAELTVNGYSNIPLHMVGMKRPATPTLDIENSLSAERSDKKIKTECGYNSIVSSLSSSRRGIAKEMQEFSRGEKRKPDEETFVGCSGRDSKQAKPDSSLPACKASSTPVPENRPKPNIPDSAVTMRVVKETSTQSESLPVPEEMTAPQSLKKKCLFNAEKGARKVKSGIEASMDSSKSKPSMLDVTVSLEDYERDREAEGRRAVDPLQELQKANEQKTAAETPKPTLLAEPQTSQTVTKKTVENEGTTSLTSLLASGDKAGKAPTGFLSALASATAPASTSAPAPVATTPQVSAVSSSVPVSTTTAPPAVGQASTEQQKYSFKPVFPTTLPATTSAATTQSAASGGFTLSQAKTDSTVPTFPQVKTDNAVPTLASQPAAPTSTVVSNSTVLSGQAPVASSTFSFGSVGGQTTQQSSGIGTSSTSTLPSTGSSIFSAPALGQTATSTAVPTTGFGLATQAVTTATSNPSGFTLGSATSQAKPTSAAAPFAFGQAPAQTAATTSVQNTVPSFGSFSSAKTTTTSSSGFSFGGSQATTTASTLGFGSSAPAANTSAGFSFGMTQPSTAAASQPKTNAPTTGFGFGGTPAQTVTTTQAPQPGLFSFGSSVPSNQNAAQGGLGFGGTPQATTNAPSGFAFGASSTASNPAKTTASSGFSFGTTTAAAPTFGQTTQSSMFGSAAAPPATSTNQGSLFGSQPKTTASVFGAGSSGFNFSSGSTPAFGQTTLAPTPFGSTTTAATTTASATPFQFGSSNSTSGNTFGSSAGSTFNFSGGATNSNTAPAFGAKPASSLPVPTFPTPQTTQPAVFGQNSGSAFGSFGSKPATGVFGSSQSQSSTAPAFGQSTAPAFGQSNTAGQGGFAFGQPSSQAPSTPVKAFDFSSAAAGGPSLQFGAGNPSAGFTTPTQSAPVMNFGSATPVFGAPAGGGMFNVGSGSTAPRNRARGRRKGTKAR